MEEEDDDLATGYNDDDEDEEEAEDDARDGDGERGDMPGLSETDEESAKMRLQKRERLLREGALSDEDEQQMEAEAHLSHMQDREEGEFDADVDGGKGGYGFAAEGDAEDARSHGDGDAGAQGGSGGDWREQAREHLDSAETRIEGLGTAPKIVPAASPHEELSRAISSLKSMGQVIPQNQLDKAFDTVSKLNMELFHTDAGA